MVNSSCGTERILHLFSPSFQPADRRRVRARCMAGSSRKPPVTTSFPKIPSRRVSNARSAVRRARFPRIVRCVLRLSTSPSFGRGPGRSASPSRARVSGPSARQSPRARGRARSGQVPRPRASVPRAVPPRSRRASPCDRVADRVDRIALLARSRFPFLPLPPHSAGLRPLGRRVRRSARPRARRRPRAATRRRRAPPAARDRPPSAPFARGPAQTRRRTRSVVQSREDRASGTERLP